MSADRRHPATLVLVALAIGLAVWAAGRLRPGLNGELARHGGTVVPVEFDLDAALEPALQRAARSLGDDVSVVSSPALGWALSLPAGGDPGPGYLPPRRDPTGRALHRPTPDLAERWRKRAFNALVDRLDDRLESLPRGRGQATLPAAGALQLELTVDAPLDWLPAVLAPGRLTVWRDGVLVADHLEVIRAELDGSRVKVALSERSHPGPGHVELSLDGVPLARGHIDASAVIEVPVVETWTADARARAAMQLAYGDLPLPVRAGAARPIATP